jgi:hypothetical protein
MYVAVCQRKNSNSRKVYNKNTALKAILRFFVLAEFKQSSCYATTGYKQLLRGERVENYERLPSAIRSVAAQSRRVTG